MKFEAIWRQKEYDIPIKVVAYLGYRNGKNWWLVENSEGTTGIPEDEIILTEETKNELKKYGW